MADDMIYVNVEDGSKRVMNNTKLFVKLLTKFKDEQTIKEIEATIKEGDMARAQVATHTFKGLTANLSLTELNKQCIEMEAKIKAGVPVDEHLALLKEVYENTLKEVDKVIAQYA